MNTNIKIDVQRNELLSVETSWAGKITLKELFASKQLIIIHFLRNFGCIYCHSLVDSLYAAIQQNPKLPPVAFVHLEDLETGKNFFKERFPGALHIADTEQQLYQLFGIKKFSILSFLNFKMLWKGVVLFAKGYRPGAQIHPQILSGTFLVSNGSVIWGHQASYPGDDKLFPPKK